MEKIENNLSKIKKEYNEQLAILSKAVSNKYDINGYCTEYNMAYGGVNVAFQRVGHYAKKMYFVRLDEIEDDMNE